MLAGKFKILRSSMEPITLGYCIVITSRSEKGGTSGASVSGNHPPYPDLRDQDPGAVDMGSPLSPHLPDI